VGSLFSKKVVNKKKNLLNNMLWILYWLYIYGEGSYCFIWLLLLWCYMYWSDCDKYLFKTFTWQ